MNATIERTDVDKLLTTSGLGFLSGGDRPDPPSSPAAAISARAEADVDALMTDVEWERNRLEAAMKHCSNQTDAAAREMSERYEELTEEWDRLAEVKVAHDQDYSEAGLRIITRELRAPKSFEERAIGRGAEDCTDERHRRDIEIRMGAAILEAVCEDAGCGIDEMYRYAGTVYVEDRIDGIARKMVGLLEKYGLFVASTGGAVTSPITLSRSDGEFSALLPKAA